MSFTPRTIRCFVAFASSLCWVQASGEPRFESEQTFDVRDVLDAQLIEGAHYSIEEEVATDGYFYYFEVQTEYGGFSAAGVSELQQLIREVNALATLDELSKTEVFAAAAKEAGVAQIRTIKDFARRPVKTVAGIPKGIGRLIVRTEQKTKSTFRTVFRRGDSDQESSANGGTNSAATVLRQVSRDYFSVTGAERRWARKLGTDPYTDNELLVSAIREFAWAERLGSVGAGFAGIPSLSGVGVLADVNDLVWGFDPYELKARNRKELLEIGVAPSTVDAFLDDSVMTPTQVTATISAISAMAGVEGRQHIAEGAIEVETADEARFFVESLSMLAWYHSSSEDLARIEAAPALPVGFKADGHRVHTLAVDHLMFTEEVATALDRFVDEADTHESASVWLMGTASDRTRREFVNHGLILNENTRDAMHRSQSDVAN